MTDWNICSIQMGDGVMRCCEVCGCGLHGCEVFVCAECEAGVGEVWCDRCGGEGLVDDATECGACEGVGTVAS